MRLIARLGAWLALPALMSPAGAASCINDNASKLFQPAFGSQKSGEVTLAARISEYDAAAGAVDPQNFILRRYYADGKLFGTPVGWTLEGLLTATGLFAPVASLGGMPSDILLADVNGDGRGDLLLSLGPYVFYYQGFSANRLGRIDAGVITENLPQQALTVGVTATPESFFSRPQPIKLGATPGLLVASSHGLGLWTLVDGAFVSSSSLVTGTAVERVAVLDVNRDGVQDVAFVSAGKLETRLQDGTGNFSIGSEVTLAQVPSVRLAKLHVPDLDGDGYADLLLEGEISQAWLTKPAGWVGSENIPSPYGVLLVDVDHDGFADVLPRQGMADCGVTPQILPAWRNDGQGTLVLTPGNYAMQDMWQLAEVKSDQLNWNDQPILEYFPQNEVLNGVYRTNGADIDSQVALISGGAPEGGTQILYTFTVGAARLQPQAETLLLTVRYPETAWIASDGETHPNFALENCALEQTATLLAGEALRQCLVDDAMLSGTNFSLLLDRQALGDSLVEIKLSLPQQTLDLDTNNNTLQLRVTEGDYAPAKKPSTLLGSVGWSLLLFMLTLLMRPYIYDLEGKKKA